MNIQKILKDNEDDPILDRMFQSFTCRRSDLKGLVS